ncbi:MAG: hypothetical protein OXE52_11145 [Chloroflexi bacterium]|nr:hypothetical protein [Chloroflexota bacterium]
MPAGFDAQPAQKSALFSSLPAEWELDLIPQIQALLRETRQKVFVLDDDPTGTQTVYDTVVLTNWSVDALRREMQSPDTICYILTNSRSVDAKRAAAINREIAYNLQAVSDLATRPFTVISRSDSTLRGHFPAETDALANSLAARPDGILIIPAFMAGGRYTIRGVHYVEEGDALIPAAATPFARDPVFAYANSELSKWVEEKTEGEIAAPTVARLSIDEIRLGGPSAVTDALKQLRGGAICVVDAVSERDLAVVALACLRAEAAGKKLIYRTAASFAGIRGGIPIRAPLNADEMNLMPERGGLVVVGSFVEKSSEQLAVLLESGRARGLEVKVPELLASTDDATFTEPIVEELNTILEAGNHAVVYTSRQLVAGQDETANFQIGKRVSACLVQIARGLRVPPRFIIAKGGITSSDLATEALSIVRARILGQILPGIPVWQPDVSSRYAGGTYVVFPGNVGDEGALLRAVEILSASDSGPLGA